MSDNSDGLRLVVVKIISPAGVKIRCLRLVCLLSLSAHVLHIQTIYEASTPWTGWHRTRHVMAGADTPVVMTRRGGEKRWKEGDACGGGPGGAMEVMAPHSHAFNIGGLPHGRSSLHYII
ncbi:hypothetical protein IGI04_000323, partial [Brassica rapa subsp. trilocularis]